jgi:ATP-binding cassette subfamily F protein 3
LNKIPDKIIELTKTGLVIYEGNYDAYCERQRLNSETSEKSTEKKTKPKNQTAFRTKEQRRQDAMRKARIRELEELIAWLERETSALQDEITQEEVYTDYQLVTEKTIKIDENTKKLEACYEEWEMLQEEE